MTPRLFQPGFRLDAKDLGVIVLGALLVIFVARFDGFLALLFGFSVGHFFLFCNILRMARIFELGWAAVFLALSGSTLASGQPGETLTILGTLIATALLTALQLRHPSYHGIAWKRLNPGLPDWWAKQESTAKKS